MNTTDPIADALTRIRNALLARHKQVSMPSSKMKVSLARILRDEGYVNGFSTQEDDKQGVLTVTLKYGPRGEKVVNGLERVSRPGRRIYCGTKELPRVLGGMGIAIVSTSRGVMTERDCRKHGIGGEVLCRVW